jgi:hypothetical protein
MENPYTDLLVPLLVFAVVAGFLLGFISHFMWDLGTFSWNWLADRIGFKRADAFLVEEIERVRANRRLARQAYNDL